MIKDVIIHVRHARGLPRDACLTESPAVHLFRRNSLLHCLHTSPQIRLTASNTILCRPSTAVSGDTPSGSTGLTGSACSSGGRFFVSTDGICPTKSSSQIKLLLA